jgi:hypothetical protein
VIADRVLPDVAVATLEESVAYAVIDVDHGAAILEA